MSSRVCSLTGIVALVYAACLPIHAQDYNKAVQAGQQAWDKGGCKDAEAAFLEARRVARDTVGLVDRAELDRTLTRLMDASVCVGDYDDALGYAGELQVQSRVALFLRAEAEKGKGQYDLADKDYGRATEGADPSETELPRFWAGWAELARLEGNFQEAGDRIAKSLALLNDSAARNSPRRAYAELVAGDLSRERGDFEKAGQQYGEALKITETLGPEHPVAGKAVLGLGWIELAQGKLDLAEQEIRKAESASRRTTTSDLYMRAVDARAMLELAKKNFAGAKDSLQEILENQRMNRRGQHPATAVIIHHLGLVLMAQQQVDPAIEQFKSAEEIQRGVLGGEHPELAATLADLGHAYRIKRAFDKSKAALDEALRIDTARLGEKSAAASSTRVERARLFTDMGQLANAEADYRATLAAADPSLHADTIRGLALVLRQEGKNADAQPLIEEWMKVRGQSLPVADPERLPVAFAAAEISLQMQNYQGAEGQFREILRAVPASFEAQKGLADSLFGLKSWHEAATLYAASLPSVADQTEAARGWVRLAECYSSQQQWAESAGAAQKALALAKGFPEPELQAIRLRLVGTSIEAGHANQALLDEWLTARAGHPAPLTAAEAQILDQNARALETGKDYALAERVLGALIDETNGAPPGAVNLNQKRAEFAEVSAAENKNAQAAETYERLARRVQAVRLADSEKYLTEAAKLREKEADPIALVGALQALGDTYLEENKFADAKPLFERAGSLLKQNGRQDSPGYAATLNGLGVVVQSERDFEQAGALFKQADDLLAKATDAPKALRAAVYFHMGSLKMADGKMDEANDYFERCLQLDPPPEEFDGIARGYERQQKYDKAEDLYKKNLELRRQSSGDNSMDTGWAWYYLAVLYKTMAKYDQAVETGEKALQIFEANAGPESDEASFILDVLATSYHMKGDGQRAIADAAQSAEIETKLGRPRGELTPTLNTLGEYLRDYNNFGKALETYQQIAELWKSESYANPNYRSAVRNMVVSYTHLKDFDKAGKLYRELHTALVKEADPFALQQAAKSYAEALEANGKTKDARKIRDQVAPAAGK